MMNATSRARHAAIMGAFLSCGVAIDPFARYAHRQASPKQKECLECGTIHFHHNAYCSAECAQKHRESRPKAPVMPRRSKKSKRKRKK